MILWVVFISSPSIIFTAYLINKLKEILASQYGIFIDQNLYWVILFISMWITMSVTSKNVLKQAFSRKDVQRQAEIEKESGGEDEPDQGK